MPPCCCNLGVPTAQRVATPKAQQQLARSWNSATHSLHSSRRRALLHTLGGGCVEPQVAVATGHAHSACVCIQLEVACGVVCCAPVLRDGWHPHVIQTCCNLLHAYIPGSLAPAAARAGAWPMPSSCCLSRWPNHLSRHNEFNYWTPIWGSLGQLGHLEACICYMHTREVHWNLLPCMQVHHHSKDHG